MIRFLASVRDPDEAEIALATGADIVDLKEPNQGALGAVEQSVVAETARVVAGRAAVSATLGDVPMDPDRVADAVERGARLGVDYLKLGLFPDGDPLGCLTALAGHAHASRLILVLFADRLPSFDAVAAAAEIGACGIMLDTADKQSGSLLDHLSLADLSRFVTAVRANGLVAGLAGSLKAEHVPALLALQPDVLGFRGALCRDHLRRGTVDAIACRTIRALIPHGNAPVILQKSASSASRLAALY